MNTAPLYDPFLWLGEKRGMAARRRHLLGRARGRVLEVGAGTGLNAPHYPAGVELVLTEPVEEMAALLERRVARTGVDATVVLAGAEALPFEDGEFDTVVSTMVLCTVEDPERAIAEIRRVLRPGGQLLFIEHVRSHRRGLAWLQDRLERPWKAFGDGCRCNRDTLTLIDRSFRDTDVEHARWRGMPVIVHPLFAGAATT